MIDPSLLTEEQRKDIMQDRFKKLFEFLSEDSVSLRITLLSSALACSIAEIDPPEKISSMLKFVHQQLNDLTMSWIAEFYRQDEDAQ